MRFNILGETEKKIRIMLDCGDYFFKKKSSVTANISAIIFFILFICFFIFCPWTKMDSNSLIMIGNLFFLIGLIIYSACYEKGDKKPVIMEITPNEIIVNSWTYDKKEPITIEKLNIKNIYVQVEKLDDYLIHRIDKRDFYTVILQTKKPIQLQNDEKDKILLYRKAITEAQYSYCIEPSLNKIKNMLNLSTETNITIVKQYDKSGKEIEKFW